jgi:membrane protease YdiL (CAAX protease family)
MTTLKQFATRHPFIFAVLLSLLPSLINLIQTLLEQQVTGRAGRVWLGLAGNTLMAVLAIVLLTGLGWWRAAGFYGPVRWRALPALWLPALVALLPVAGILAGAFPVPSADQLVVWGVLYFILAFQEEALNRGVILNAFLPSGRLRAVLLAALLFGLSHVSAIVQGQHVLMAVVNMIAAFSAGLLSAALLLRTGTIWPLILIHLLFDYLGRLTTPTGSIVSAAAPEPWLVIFQLVLAFIYAGYGLFLLRHEWFPRSPQTDPQLVA